MSINRYLMQPYPRVLAVSLTYDGMGAAASDGAVLAALFGRLELELDLQQTYKGIAHPMRASVVGLLGSAQVNPAGPPRYVGFFCEGAREWSCFDDASTTAIGPDWAAVAAHCAAAQIQPAVLLYALPLQFGPPLHPAPTAASSAPPSAA